jgi:hypothetical protein
VLLLEAREPELDRCEPRVLLPLPPADFVYSCYGFAGLRLHSLLVAEIPSPVRLRQPQAPLGSDEPDAPLLRELELGAGGEGDLVIGGEQGDQGDHEASQSRGKPWPGSNPGDQGSDNRC